MKIYTKIEEIRSAQPIALSIGVFDGVHLGHQAVLKRLKNVASLAVAITFSNHPAELFQNATVDYLTTLPHRLRLLEEMGIDHLIVLPFDRAFAAQTAHEFLTSCRDKIAFSHLILGHDATLGTDRCRNLHDLSQNMQFSLEYLPAIFHNQEIISSRRIRKAIQEGRLLDAAACLGRPYSISASVQTGHGKGRELGFHTANLPVTQLALPPTGVWAVQVKLNNETIPAIANLGHAPTIHADRALCLEVHLIDDHRDLYGHTLEVIFHQFIRPEQRFPHLQALKAQISRDIQLCKTYLFQN